MNKIKKELACMIKRFDTNNFHLTGMAVTAFAMALITVSIFWN